MRVLHILLNGGHGNDTPGKRWTFDGVTFYEYLSNRETADRVKKKLEAEGIICHIITPELNDIPLKVRSQRVNQLCAKYGKENCLLLEIHSNASVKHTASGISLWTSKGKTESDIYAEFFYETGKTYHPTIRMMADLSDGDHDYEESFHMVKRTACAAVLVETCFYDNKKDFDYLMSEEGRENIANWYVASIKKCIEYYNKKYNNV